MNGASNTDAGRFIPELDVAAIRVLHVDDEPDLLDLAATFLERDDDAITVVTATSVDEGLERLDQEAIDCIVSDYQMPANGLEFLETVRTEHPNLPFILFTGQGSEEIAGEAIANGVTDYLQKESSTSQYEVLANRIRNTVEQYRAEQELDTLRRRYELVARASADAFADWDLETGHLWWSEGLQRTFGYDADEIENDFEWWTDRVHPDDRQRIVATIEQTFTNTDELLEIDHRFQRADGTYAHIISRGYVVYKSGDPVRVAGALIDITERTQRDTPT